MQRKKIPAKVALSFIKTPDEPSVERMNKNLGVTTVQCLFVFFFNPFIEMF